MVEEAPADSAIVARMRDSGLSVIQTFVVFTDTNIIPIAIKLK